MEKEITIEEAEQITGWKRKAVKTNGPRRREGKHKYDITIANAAGKEFTFGYSGEYSFVGYQKYMISWAKEKLAKAAGK